MAKILLAEDEDFFREILKNVLTEGNHEVTIAPDGAVAQHIAGMQDFDLVLSDIRMPKMDGIALLKWLREKKPELPVVLMTGFSEILETEQAYEMGAKNFLTKPFKEEEIIEVITKTLALPKAKKEDDPEADGGYFKINIDDFTIGNKLPCSIFIKLPGGKYLKIAHSGQDIDVDQIRRYKEKAVKHLFMNRKDYEAYMEQTLRIAKLLTISKKISPEKKQAFMKHTGEIVLEKIFSDEIDGGSFSNASCFVEMSLSLIAEDAVTLDLLSSLSQHSDHVYAHSIGVSTYSVMIAQYLQWHSPNTIFKLALGGLFHDIGKKEIEKEILDKPRNLHTAEDRAIIESHPRRGVNILQGVSTVPSDIYDIVFQHHEDLKGHGYPQHLTRSKIHPLAKVVSVANAFCRYAIKNPDSPGMAPSMAMDHVERFHRDEFDATAMEALKSMIVPKIKK